MKRGGPRGTTWSLPRRERLRLRNTWRWALWCGWCRRDHTYGKSYPRDVVMNTHRDRMEHECREKALD